MVVGVVTVCRQVQLHGPWKHGVKAEAHQETVVACGVVKAELVQTMHIVIGQVGVAAMVKCGVTVYVCVFVVHQVMEHILDSLLG